MKRISKEHSKKIHFRNWSNAEQAIYCQSGEICLHDTSNLDFNKMQQDFKTEEEDGKAFIEQLAKKKKKKLEGHW